MVLAAYLLQALLAYAVSTATLSLASISSPSQRQLGSQSQAPLDRPGCDGSGIVGPDGRCNGDGLVDDPSPADKKREGFRFENPSTDCKYVSQMHIWDTFKSMEKDLNVLFKVIHKDVDFTVVGHHPIAGHYRDLMHWYVNALRRVGVLFSDHTEEFEVHPRAIHGGCNDRWSVAEVNFKGVMNSGDHFDIVNVWVVRWHEEQMVEMRTYIDAGPIMDALHKNEMWWNGTSSRDHTQYIPGPAGMPDLKKLEGLMGYPNGSKYRD